MPQTRDAAPLFDPDTVGLPWWRRALAQGVGYMLPSVAFLIFPIAFGAQHGPARLAAMVSCTLAVLVFYLGACLVMGWPTPARWAWLAGLTCAVAALAALSQRASVAAYFGPYLTVVAAILLSWRTARVTILTIGLALLGTALISSDMFGVIMAVMAFALAWSIGSGIEQGQMKAALAAAEQRTAVLAVAAERERIGRDLHDILGHSLTTIAVKADLAHRLVGRDNDAARAEVESLAGVARQALADVRATASGMREVRLAGEVAAARAVLEAGGVECRTPSALPVLDDAHSEMCGYVVREAVTNVARHAGASACSIEVDESSVAVSDNGVGIRPGAIRTGLAGLATRVADAGGQLAVESGPDGTTVRASWEAGT